MSFGLQFVKFADSSSPEGSAPRRVSSFYNATGVKITNGSLVAIDVADTTHGVGASLRFTSPLSDAFNVVGVADQDIDAGQWGPVVTYGVKNGCKASSTPIGSEAGVVSSGTHPGALWGAGVGLNDTDHNYIGIAISNSYPVGSLDPLDDNVFCDVFLTLG